MCGRYNFSNHKDLNKQPKDKVNPSFNIAPSQNVLTINSNEDIISIKWGYQPDWLKKGQIINAQRETLKTKPTFRGYLQCYVPINGWYEWLREGNSKQPYYFYSTQDTMYVKSIVKDNSLILLTTKAIENISHIHHRMPLIVNEPNFMNWNLNRIYMNVNLYPINNKVNYSLNEGKKIIKKIN